MTPTLLKERDSILQGITDRDPEFGEGLMDTLGYGPANRASADALPPTPYTYSTYDGRPTSSIGLAESVVASKDAFLSNLEKETAALTAEQGQGKQQIGGLLNRMGSLFRKRESLYESEGINDERRAIASLANEIDSRGRSYDKQIEALEKNPNRQFGGTVDKEINKLQREKARELADYSIALNARTRNLEVATSYVDQKVDAETEELKFNLDSLQYFYDKNESRLNDNQKTILQNRIKEADRVYEEGRSLRKEIGSLQLAAAQNNAPVSVIRAIGNAQTVEDAIGASGGFLGKRESGSSSYEISLSADDRRALAGAGFTAGEIEQIRKDVNASGIEAVLEGIESETQKAAIKKVFGGSAEDAVTLNRETLAKFYGIADNDVKTGGFLGIGGETGRSQLDALETAVERYRAVGYTDKEILKLIQAED